MKTHYFLNKNATLTSNSCDFWDLRTFVANFFVAIYALFPQIFWDWKAKSADFYTFRMYVFSLRTLFLAKIFSTQKRVNRNKPILRQNSGNRQKNTNFATKQFKMQQNTINCTHIAGDFRFLHFCHVKKFEMNPHVDEF